MLPVQCLSPILTISSATILFFLLLNPSFALRPLHKPSSPEPCAYNAATNFDHPLFKLICSNKDMNSNITLLLKTRTLDLLVSSINHTARTMRVAIDPTHIEDSEEGCPLPKANFTFPNADFYLTSQVVMATFFYKCSPKFSAGFSTNACCENSTCSHLAYEYGRRSPLKGSSLVGGCVKVVEFPALRSMVINNSKFGVSSLLKAGFELGWIDDDCSLNCSICLASGEHCWINRRFGSSFYICVGVGTFLAVVFALVFCAWKIKKKKGHRGSVKVEKFLSDFKSLSPTRYTYKEIKGMTNNFEHSLGQGAHGIVFKGALPNGSPAAIKLIKKSYKDGEEFINEVATISRICHKNVVRLHGFCVEGSQRAIVYEFMANGSLEKFISAEGEPLLAWERLYDIAIGIAHGIEYLHHGCDLCIIHFDIKPNNILLDHDFTPKISDFGLAELHGKEENGVCIAERKGTVGYIAPEVYCGSLNIVSHKSDVYSFGMLLLDMVGMKKHRDSNADSSGEVYFPLWIYECLSRGEMLDMEMIGEVEREIVTKITAIALWCIQWKPVDRPCMKQVLRMFEADMEDLAMPPNCFYPAIQLDDLQDDPHSIQSESQAASAFEG